jgi:tape measure domain-containing protein
MADNTLRIKIELLLGDLNTRLQRLRGDLNNLGNGENNAKKALDSTEKSAGVLGSTVGRVSSEIKGMLAGAFAVGALVAFTNKLVETVRVIQDLRLRLSGLTKGNEDFAASEAYLIDLAHRHHKSVQDLTGSYSAFLALEQSGIITRQQSIQLLEGFSNAQSKFGVSNTQVAQSTYGLAQALGTGIVAMEEYKQITEPMSGLSNEIAKSFGMSVGELRKLIGTGTLASEVFGKHMVEALDAYKGAAERSGGTITASYNDVSNAYTEMAKELEKPVAGAAIGVVDAGKAAYSWLKDNGNAIVTTLTAIAAVMVGKSVSAMAAYTKSGIESIQVEQAHAAAIIENEQRTVSARQTKVTAAEAKLAEKVANTELMASTVLLTDVEISLAEADALVTGSTTRLASAQTARAVAEARLTAATHSQAAADAFLASQNAKLAASQLALTEASNASGVAMTRLGAAAKSAMAMVGGPVGVAVLALWGLYEVLNSVTGAEEKAEAKAKALTDALGLMNAEVKKLTAEDVDIDFSKTLSSIDEVNAKIKELETFQWGKILNVGDLAEQRANLEQQKEVLTQRLAATTEKKNDIITNFDASGLSSAELNTALSATQAEIKALTDKITPLQVQVKEGLIGSDAINADLLKLNSLNSKLSAIQGSLNAASNTGKVDPKIAEANAKAEEKTIEGSFKLKEQSAKNAHDLAIAEAGKDSVKRLQIERNYNEQVLQLTLARLDAEKAAKIKTSELSGKKTKGPELQAELAEIENKRALALDDANTKRGLLGVEAKDNAKELEQKKLEAKYDTEMAGIELKAEQATAESKIAIDELKRLKDQGGLSGSGKFDTDIKKASQKHGFDYEAVQAQFEKSGAAHGVPAELLRAQVKQESGFNPRIGSSAGAYGFSQFIEGTANQYGLKDRSDPIASIEAQAKMMGEKIKQYGGRLDLALAAYNGGDKGADYLASNPQYLKNPVARIKGDAKHNSSYKVETANYQKNILSSAGLAGGKSSDEKQLIEQAISGTQHFYDEKIKAEGKGIDASIAAVKAKLALADKQYATQKADATPEQLPKIESDYATNKAKLTQELSQLQAELLAIKKDGDAEMAKEIAKAKQDEIDLEEAAALDLVKVAETDAQQQLELGQLSNGKFLEKQQQFEDQRYQIALKAAQDRRGLLDEGDVSGKAKALGAEKALTNKHAADLKGINHKMALDSKAAFNSMVSPIKSAFSSSIQGILQGTTTLKQGMKNAFQSIVLSYAGSLANMAIDAAAHWAWELLGFGAKETTKTTEKTTAESAQTAAAIAGDQARVVSTTAAAAQSYAVHTASALSSIAKNAAVSAAGAFSAIALIPYVGPALAPVAAATAYAATMMYAPLASSAGGEWDVPNDRINLVHKNETILPATIAAPMREFFTKQGNLSYGLPDSATQPTNNQAAGVMITAASALAQQQSMMQAQQKQQRQSGEGTVVINGKGGDWVHKNDLAKVLKNDNRNFRMA